MQLDSLADFPDQSRVWIFGAGRALSGEEERALLGEVDAFLGEWRAHGVPLRTAREWRDGRFLIVGVDERTEPPSGCSIDALVRVLKQASASLGVPLVDNTPIWHRDSDGDLQRSTRAEFKRLAESGEVSAETIVYDNTVTRLGQIRAGAWELPAGQCWHARAFGLGGASPARARKTARRLVPASSGPGRLDHGFRRWLTRPVDGLDRIHEELGS